MNKLKEMTKEELCELCLELFEDISEAVDMEPEEYAKTFHDVDLVSHITFDGDCPICHHGAVDYTSTGEEIGYKSYCSYCGVKLSKVDKEE